MSRFLSFMLALLLLQGVGALQTIFSRHPVKNMSTDIVTSCPRAGHDQQMNIMDIVNSFEALLDKGQFEEASTLLSDDFEFSTPRHLLNKISWLKEFPQMHKDRPNFSAFVPGNNDKEVKRTGKKKIMAMSLTMVETWTFTDDGKILSIKGAKA